ncbi:MAG: hypothetical protein WAN65_32495 [Candidatus Sulfotelmatobacter sp.]
MLTNSATPKVEFVKLPVRFGYSIFGRPGNQPYVKGPNASLIWLFTATLADLYAYKYHETRVAGFGPYFSGCLILAFLLALVLIVTMRSVHWPLMLMATVLICSLLLLSRHLWWPRYGPQLWLLPILPIAFAFHLRVAGAKLALARTILFLLILDTGIVSWVRLQWETNASVTLRHQLKQLKEPGQVYEVQTNYFDDSWRVRLLEAGVRFQDVGMKGLADSQELMSVVEGYPLPVRYRMISGVISGP